MRTGQLHYEEVEVGSFLPPVTRGPIASELLVRWAAGSGDFNPIHYDKDWALSQGLPNVVIAGPMKAAMLANFVANWASDVASVKMLQCRYTAMDVPGDTLTLSGKIIAKELIKDGGKVVCEIWIQNQRGEITVKGTATLILPTQAR